MKHLFFLFSFLLSLSCWAYDAEIDGIYYDFIGSEAKVTNGDSYYKGDVVIPNTVKYQEKTYNVTSIGGEAFLDCYHLTAITIPNSVTSIDYYAFCNCYHLTAITIPNSVTSIGRFAFAGCSGLTSVTIPNSVTLIGERAFTSCSGLTSVTIPNSVTEIGCSAFAGCRSLTSVTIPNSVTEIGSSAFDYCSGLTSVTINSNAVASKTYSSSSTLVEKFGVQVKSYVFGEDVQSIGAYACYYCSGLTSVTFGNNVTEIGCSAFANCSRLTSVTIPNSVTEIGNLAFGECSGLTSIVVESGNTKYDSRNDCNAIIETVSNTLVAGCKNTIIPNSVTSIGSSAFYGCSALTSVTIPNSVTEIAKSAFKGCSGLTSVTINSNAVASKTSSSSSSFANIFGTQVKHYIFGDDVQSIGAYACYNCSSLTSVTIPNSVTTIGSDAFAYCNSLTSVTIPNSVTTIESDVFTYCQSLTSVTIPEGVTSIGDRAFRCCYSLETINIPESVINIGSLAFMACKSLKSITIPKNVTSINKSFYECGGLESIVVAEGNTVYDSRDNCNAIIETATQKLLLGCQNTIIPDGVKIISSGAFEACSGLTSITFPQSVTVIYDRVFCGCSGLTSITIPQSVTAIGDWAFSGCSSLKDITLPQSLTTIYEGTFSGCRSLANIIIPPSVTAIGNNAFEECCSLSSIIIPDNVYWLGKSVFWGCSALTSVTFPQSASHIEDNVFSGCEALETIYVRQAHPKQINDNVFSESTYQKASLFVPVGRKSFFEETNGWNKFSHIEEIEMPDIIVSKNPFDNIRSNQMILGYYTTTDMHPSASGGKAKGTYKACIGFDRKQIKPYIGNKITHVRFALKNTKISSFKLWISSSRYENNLYEQYVTGLQEGWNEIKLDRSFNIQDDSLFIGFEYSQNGANYPIAFNASSYDDPGCCYLYGPYGTNYEYQWRGNSSEKLSLQCLIEGDNIPQYDIRTTKIILDKRYYTTGDNCEIELYLRNWGKQNIKKYEISCFMDGREVESRPKDALTDLSAGSDIVKKRFSPDFDFSDLSVGIHTISASVKSINGDTPLYKDDDTQTAEIKFYVNKMERQKVYIEHLTATWCHNSIYSLPNLKEWMQKFNNGTFVCLHSSDGLSCVAGDNYAVLYRYIENNSQNRYCSPGESSFFGFSNINPPTDVNMKYMTNASTPPLANVNICADYYPSIRTLKIKVYGECIDDFFLLEKWTNLTVLLTEDDIVSPQYDGVKDAYIYDFKHQAVLRTNVSSVWGDPITWNGNKYEMEYAVVLDEDWEKDNMKIVAFLAKPFNGSNYDEIYVVNCNDFAVKDATTVGIDDIQGNGNESFDVYSINGMRVRQNTKDLKGLSQGIYLVNGKKMIVK